MQIHQTTNYSLFKSINSNREVDRKHVKKLVASIGKKNLLHVNPINVNDAMEVIDGQHRLEAAKILKVPIFFVQEKKLSNADISMLNSNKKTWQIIDYLNYYSIEGNQHYKTASSFINKYPNFTASLTVSILNGFDDNNGYLDVFKRGFFKVTTEQMAHDIATMLIKLEEYGKFVYQVGFVKSLGVMYKTEGFDFEVLLHQIQNQPRSFVPCINKKQYAEMLLELYNFRRHEHNRLKI
jgi:hypothetical protein